MALEIALTQGKTALIDECDSHLTQWKWCLHSMGYATKGLPSEKIYKNKYRSLVLMHHLIMGQPLNGKEVDHINGNKLDNRRNNLRIVSRQMNALNQKEHRGEIPKSSKFPGVNISKRIYGKNRKLHLYPRAVITINGKRKHLGYFKTEEDAAIAYQNKLKELEAVC